MKKSKFIKLCAILLFVLISNSVSFAQFGGGNGTQAEPYEIYTIEHLMELSDSVANYIPLSPTDKSNWSKNKYFKLINDIDDAVKAGIGCEDSTLYGNYQLETKYFQGDFDGNGKKITLAINVNRCNTTSLSYIGLFIAIYEANIHDLTVDGYFGGDYMVGGLCGYAKNSRISNCINRCNNTYVVSNDFFHANIGGFCGAVVGGSISNCINYGSIRTNASVVGGIAGDITECIVTNCVNYGYIFGSESYVGGICGEGGNYTGGVSFKDCHNYGNVWAFTTAGGITGILKPNTILSHCTNTGDITGQTSLGGITGFINGNSDISYCLNIGTIAGEGSNIGGIAGCYGSAEHRDDLFDKNYGIIHTCHNAGLVIGVFRVGGIQGDCWGEIHNCLNTGVVISNTMTSWTGGITGSTNNTHREVVIQNCHYDKQMCIHGGIAGKDIASQAEGWLTKDIIGTNLVTRLGGYNAWAFNYTDRYPVLHYFTDIAPITRVAGSPVYLYDSDIADFDRQNRVSEDFKVNLENDVKWNRVIGNVDIVNNDGLVRNDGSDTLVCSIGNYKKLVPINIQIKTIDVKDTFLLTLYANPEEGGSVTGAGKYAHDSLASITATANPCYQFVNWTDSATGRIFSENATHEFRFPNNNLTLIANFVRDSFDLALAVNPTNAGKASGGGRFACGDDTYHTIEAVPSDACFAFKNWTDEDGNVISETAKDSVIVAKNTVLTANFSNVCDIHFTIWATEHKLVAPSRRNYRIPIYIKSNEDVPADLFAINKLVIEIDNSVFYPKRTNIGTLAGKNQNEITIENIKIPALNAGEEVMLFYLIGDMLLGTIDSSEIIINQNIEFAGDFNGSPEVTNGSITLNICHEGSDRFIEVAGNSPSLTIKNNPVNYILEVECNVVESGKYKLEVVDMAGRSVKVEEFVAGGAGVLLFEIDAKQFSIGRYMVVLSAPSGRRFVENVVKR